MFNFPTHRFETNHGAVTLVCIGVDEPNSGRMLYKVKLTLGEEDITERYFGSWPYINFKLDQYEPGSANKRWIYIPQEGYHFVTDASTLKKIELPFLPLSATTFRSKKFVGDSILVVTSNETFTTNLANEKTT